MATKIYEGHSTSSSDQIYTADNGKIFKGHSTSSSDELKTNPSGIKIDNNKVYKGNSTSSSDQIMTIEGLKISVVVTLLCLFVFGFFKSRLTGIDPWSGAFRVMLIGAVAAAAAFGIAKLFEG